MFKISITDSQKQRRLIVEGMLIGPWAAELRVVCERARAALDGRKLLIELRDLTAINQEGENVLLGLMNEGVKIRSRGLFMKHLLADLARRAGIPIRKQGHSCWPVEGD